MSRSRKCSVDREWYLARLKSKKLTQREFARRAGFHLTSVIRLLNGKRQLQINEVHTVARVIDVPVEEVLRRSGLELFDLKAPQEASKESVAVAKEPALSEKINEYCAKHYWVTAAIWRGAMGESFEIGIRRKSDGRFWLLQSEKYNHQTVQEVAEVVCLALDHFEASDTAPEWCKEFLT